jgi:hypothetical protein
MANDEACLAGLLMRGEGASLGEAVVSRSLVLLAGLVCVEWVVGLLEWLVFGLGTAALLGELLATGVFDLGGRVVVDDAVGLACVSLEAWFGLLTEYGPAVAGLAASSGRSGLSGLLNLVGLIGATERPP